jgi:peptidoglycan/xylan/chitin deacetylase (PgdA/CDA1 family)
MPTSEVKPITISFDNGPHPEYTPKVLDVLARHGIKTTFFVVGKQLARHRAPAERARQEGHWIGNHTWSHSHPFREKGDEEFIKTEIEQTQAELGNLAHPDKLFRPFGGGGRIDGALNQVAADYLARNCYTCILWNSVPGDFRDAEGWPQVADQQIERLDWPLVVLHDIHGDAMTRLDAFLVGLTARGYAFRQEFPPSTIALRNGQPTPALSKGVVAD